jgi:hypothetical protein
MGCTITKDIINVVGLYFVVKAPPGACTIKLFPVVIYGFTESKVCG